GCFHIRRKGDALQRDPVPDLPAKPVSKHCARQRSGSITDKLVLLLRRFRSGFGVDIKQMIGVDRVLRKKKWMDLYKRHRTIGQQKRPRLPARVGCGRYRKWAMTARDWLRVAPQRGGTARDFPAFRGAFAAYKSERMTSRCLISSGSCVAGYGRHCERRK